MKLGRALGVMVVLGVALWVATRSVPSSRAPDPAPAEAPAASGPPAAPLVVEPTVRERGDSRAPSAAAAAPDPARLLETALELRRGGDRAEAARVLDEAQRLAMRQSDEPSPLLVRLHAERGFEAEAAGDLPLARQELLRALELAEDLHGSQSPELFERMRALVELYRRGGLDVEADALLEELALRQEGAVRGSAETREVVTLETNLARDLEQLGEDERAEARHLAAVAEVTRNPDASARAVTASLRELERFYAERGRTAESREVLERVVAVREADPDASASELGRALIDLGERQIELGEDADGRASLERAAELYAAAPTEDRGERGIRLEGLRRSALALEDYPAAARYYIEALANDGDARAPEAVVEQLRLESERWAEQGDDARGAERHALAAAVADELLGPEHPLSLELDAPLPLE